MKKLATIICLLWFICLTTVADAQLDRFGFLRRFRPQVSIPPPWSQVTLGSGLPLQGSTMYNNGEFAIQGAGANYDASDTGLHYVYQSTTGDMQIVANVTDCDILSGDGEQCGLMIRKSLSADSANFSCFRQQNPPLLRIAQWRSTDAGMTNSDGFAANGNNWLRIQKVGDQFSCWESADGATWTQVSTDQTVSVDTNYFIGMFVNSNNTAELAAGTFTNIVIQPTEEDTGTDLVLVFDRTNPFWWDNDSELDAFTFLYVLAAASNGNLNLIGASRSPNPYAFAVENAEFVALAQAAINDGWNINPSLLTNISTNLGSHYITALLKPDGTSGCDPDTDGGIDCIDDTAPIDEAPANALKDAVLMYGTHNKPMVVGAGGCLTTIASAYLLAQDDGMGAEFIDRIIVIANTGAQSIFPELKDYNSQQDEWALFIVMNKLRHVITPIDADFLTETQGQQLWDFVRAAPGEVGDFVRDVQDNWWPASYPVSAMQSDTMAVMPVLFPTVGSFFLNPIQLISPTNVWGAWPPGYPDHGVDMLNLDAYQAILSVQLDPMGDDQYITGYDSAFFVNEYTSELQQAFGLANNPPSISIAASPTGTYIAPVTITITPTYSDSDGTVDQIDYYDASNDTLLATVFDGSPYVYNNIGIGSYSIYAIATDDDLDTTTSNTLSFTVGANSGGDSGGYRPTFTGFGANSVGGHGPGTSSNVCHVTSLNDTGGNATFTGALDGGGNYTGTFRQCATGLAAPRFIVFDVCGTIQATSDYLFTQPYMTVAGQTACGEGVTIKLASGGADHYKWFINTNDLVFQHIRIRGGSTSPVSVPGGTDMIRMGGATNPLGTADNIVFDHVTFSWALHLLAWADLNSTSNIAFYDSAFYEGLNTNTVVDQNMSLLFYKSDTCTATVQRSVFAHNDLRNPLVGQGCKISVINNVVYNYGDGGQTDATHTASLMGSYGTCDNQVPCPDPTGPNAGPFEGVWIGNTYLWGPDTGNNVNTFMAWFGEKAFPPYAATPSRLWLSDNQDLRQDRQTAGRINGSSQTGQWNGVENCVGDSGATCFGFVYGVSTSNPVDDTNCNLVGGFGIRETNPSCISWYDGHNYNPMDHTTAYNYVLSHAGAFPINRDYQDDRILNPSSGEIANGTGSQLADENQGQAVKANLSFTGADAFPNLTTDASAYINPSSPWADGSCGSATGRGARWNIECDLEAIAVSVEEPPSQTLNFTADTTTNFANPETGPFWEFQNSGSTERNPPLQVYMDLGWPQDMRATSGLSTLYANYFIGDFFDTPLSQAFLDQLEGDLNTARTYGFKLIPSFHYFCAWNDPPAAQIIAHVAQIKPIWQANSDVIALWDSGMIGPCGEWWVSQPNYNVGDPAFVCEPQCDRVAWVNDNTRAIVDAWADALPVDRMFLFWPMQVRMLRAYSSGIHPDPQPTGPYNPGAPGDTSLSEAEAFSGSKYSRIGNGNQCFLTDIIDGIPTYDNDTHRLVGPSAFLEVDGKYTPGIWFPDTSCGYSPTPEELLAELDRGAWDLGSGDGIVNETFPGSGWSTPAVLDFFRQIGYRYRLISAQLPESATHGIGSYTVGITITNDAGGMIFNPRNIELILRNQTTGNLYTTNYDGDGKGNRLMFPAKNATKDWTISIPLSGVPAGNYDLILNLPDPYPSIHDNPLYSIRLANTGTWEASTGFNVLSTSIVID